MQSSSGIPYRERPGYSEHWSKDQNEVTRTLVCAWEDRRAFRRDLLGYVTGVGNGRILRSLPDHHPTDDWLICTAADLTSATGVPVEEIGNQMDFRLWDEGELIRDGLAIFRAVYQSVLYEVLPDDAGLLEYQRFTIWRQKWSTEAQKFSGGSWRFTDALPGAGIILEPLSLTYHTREIVAVQLQIPQWSETRIAAALNHVNVAAWPTGVAGFSFDPQTLLYSGFNPEPGRAPTGERCSQLNHTWLWRASGWNSLFRANDPNLVRANGAGYYPVAATNGGRLMYPTADFDTIFLPA